ncbi:mitochondrial 37S ribosomal protein [Saccharomycopsis crataegensis]|uniref:Mitochondrial 37S ribosomal protein n=1 Tax=Saccharomycopsis crataegensis TaxID=43959 RepID=A0AAV5QDP9_9ASCO|nr:mitochondrial 37S ribosomal protein [Saccharomycopsis crataegensis]
MYLLRNSLKTPTRSLAVRASGSPLQGSKRSFIKPSLARFNEVKEASKVGLQEPIAETKADATAAAPKKTPEPQQESVKEPVQEETTTAISDSNEIAFLRKINDESIQFMQEISQLSETRSNEIVSQIQQQQKEAKANDDKLNKLNVELEKFFEDYIGTSEKFTGNYGDAGAAGMGEQYNPYPYLKKSARNDPYTEQELYIRRVHHSKTSGALGSKTQDTYRPFADLAHPVNYKELTIEKLMASGAHLGHSTALFRASTQPYIYGEYRGIHIIDLEKTLSHLKRASKVIEGIAEKGGVILFLGTREGQQRAVESAARRCKGYYVSHKWIPGTITNSTEISKNWTRREVDLKDEATGRELTEHENSTNIKPDLIVFLNPTENRTALKEAADARVPTVGIIDTDSEPSLVTYPIPANDDSVRAINLICGVLGKAAQIGRERRIARVNEYIESLQHVSTKDTASA